MNRFLRVICVAIWFAFFAWAGTIVYLSSLSGNSVEELNVFHLWDKLAHFAAFAAGGLLLAAGLRGATNWSRGTILWRTALALALFAAADEWHQMYTPGRTGADVSDWLADVFGTAAGAAAALAWPRRAASERRSEKPVRSASPAGLAE
jgi:VanZ family protein